MSYVFRNKKISILIVAAIVLALILVCMLLTTLCQMSSLKQSAENLKAQIAEVTQQEVELNDLIQFMQTEEYVRWWAENSERMSKDDILWIAEQANKLANKDEANNSQP